MSEQPESIDIDVKGDFSGNFINGNNNQITTHPVETPESRPSQRNRAEDHASVYAVTHGTMHITVNRPDGEESADANPDEPAAQGPGR